MAGRRQNAPLDSLPYQAAVIVLEFLDWYERLSVATVSRRLRLLCRRGMFLRHSRFSLRDHPLVFSYVTCGARAELIQELDVCNYVTVSSHRLQVAIRNCVNLTVLRCVHTRLHPLALISLLRNYLRKLRHLEWSILKNQVVGTVVPDFLASLGDCNCGFAPATLRYMYVEAVCNDVHTIEFALSILAHCHGLSQVHFHERGTSGKEPDVACAMLKCLGTATEWSFESFTYTSQRLPSDWTLPTVAPAFAPTGNVFIDFRACADVFKNIAIHIRPRYRRSCVHLAETVSTENMEGLKQLSVMVQDSNDVAALMRTAYEQQTYRYVEGLSLTFLFEPTQHFRGCIRNRAALCNFLRSCYLLTELNFFSFHSEAEFDYLSILVTGGLDTLRNLAIVACALCTPVRLQRLAQASFELQELDVRSWRGMDADNRVICDLCRDESTCNDACLAPMRRLRHLRRLTICDLVNVRRLAFLEGCDSLVHLRLRNLGMWCFNEPQEMISLRHVWLGLESLKLESSVLSLDLSFLHGLPPSQRLERLCVGTIGSDARTRELRPEVLRAHCPNAEVIHVHVRDPNTRGLENYIMGPIYHEVDPLVDDDVNSVWLLSRDEAMLCYCLSYIGFEKPRCLWS